MNHCHAAQLKLLAAAFVVVTVFSGCASSSPEPLTYVDPSIGGVGHLLQPTRPTVQLPNQMIRMYPDRGDYLDDRIRSFPLTLLSHRQGMLFKIMPYANTLAEGQRWPESAWEPENEVSTPYYYAVWLRDYDTTLEFAPGAKTAVFRLTFPENASRHVMVESIRDGNWKTDGHQTVTAVENFDGMHAWLYGQFNTPFTFEPYRDARGSVLSWTPDFAGPIEFRYAVSFISPEQAQANFEDEIRGRSFEQVKTDAHAAWADVLNQIEVEGGTPAQRRTFYTALYRCYERMVDITEDGRYYSNYDHRVHNADRPFYVDDWVWDTYLAHHPLRCILHPDQEADMIQSYVRMYQQSGWMPTFPILTGDTPCMNGFHSTIMMLDAWRKGITDFDTDVAYQGMKKNALEATMLPWRNGPKCALDDFYAQNGYYPALHPGQAETEPAVHGFEKRQAVAVTLGHSYDDWALSQFAAELGHDEDAARFAERAQNYRNLYWAEKGFFMPKDDQGKWIDIDPKFDGGMGGRDYYDENNGWTYLWQVQHDVPGLMDLMGGKAQFERRLDRHFREGLGRSKQDFWSKFPDSTGMIGQFSMGNEVSFHIPYLYNFTDAPWKTQEKIRLLLNTWYPDTIFGIPGDEDGGGMSAFVVFSCMGFYPVTPGKPVYTIGSPIFEKITIHLENGKDFTVRAPGCSDTNKYIQKAYLNGKSLNAPWFTHRDLMNGGELTLVMGQKPNKNWGTDTALFEMLWKPLR